MIHTPATIVDNFFDDPNAVRDFALKQEFYSDETGQWPGLRTKELHLIDSDFFNFVFNRYFSLFYPDISTISWTVGSYFQLVNKDHKEGWIHKDNSEISGIIYLSPNPNIDAGTSIYKSKNMFSTIQNSDIKRKWVEKEITDQEAEFYRKQNNENFVETLRVNNVYNRLISFDGHLPHKANSFFGNDKFDARLTLVFFVYSLTTCATPLARMRRF